MIPQKTESNHHTPPAHQRRRSSLQQAIEFGSQLTPTFILEDTNDRSYRDIIEIFEVNGWRRVPYRKRSKVEKRRLPLRDIPQLIWLLNENDVDFNDLTEEQICNHFEGIHQITTKQGICELSKNFHEIHQNSLEMIPRSYNLGNPIDREEFIDDFRASTAFNLLKYYLIGKIGNILQLHNLSIVNIWKEMGTMNTPMNILLKNAMFACLWEIRIHHYGEYPCVDISKYFRDKEQNPLNEEEWYYLLLKSYDTIQQIGCFEELLMQYDLLLSSAASNKTTVSSPSSSSTAAPSLSTKSCIISLIFKYYPLLYRDLEPTDFRILNILCLYQRYHYQYQIDGYRNIWIIKSPDSSCGIGMKLSCQLDEILEYEKSMSGRIVQKYIEQPLLSTPLPSVLEQQKGLKAQNLLNVNIPPIITKPANATKFDIRIWVLVTSFQPLQAHIYTTVYGRRCSSPYSLDISTLSDHYIHLTNYTLQKKHKKFQSTVSNEQPQHNRRNSLIGTTVSSEQPQHNRRNSLIGTTVSNEQPQHNRRNSLIGTEEEANDDETIPSTTRRLRSLCKDSRNSSSTLQDLANSNDGELLINHYELLQILQITASNSCYLPKDFPLTIESSPSPARNPASPGRTKKTPRKNRFHIWDDYLWPKIISNIRSSLHLLAQKMINPRAKSFELLGYDILIDEAFQPWILEVNMSPAMAHRSTEQSILIERMAQELILIGILPKLSSSVIQEQLRVLIEQKLKSSKEVLLQEKQPSQQSMQNADYLALGHWESLFPSTSASPRPAEIKRKSDYSYSTPSVQRKEEDGSITTCSSATHLTDDTDVTSVMSANDAMVLGTKKKLNNASLPVPPNERPKSANPTMSRRKSVVSSGEDGNAASIIGTNGAKIIYSSYVTGPGAISNAPPPLDIAFTLTGKGISGNYIDYIDSLCIQSEKVLFLQKWMKTTLKSLQLYYAKRERAALLIQRYIRRLLAQLFRHFLFRQRKAMILQCCYRQHLSRQTVFQRKKEKLANMIYPIWKIYCLKQNLHLSYRKSKVQRIIRFYYQQKRRYYSYQYYFVLRRIFHLYEKKRRYYGRKVYHALRLMYLRKKHSRNRVLRVIHGWLIRRKLHKIYQKNILKKLVNEAAIKNEEIEAIRKKKEEEDRVRNERQKQVLLELQSHQLFDKDITNKHQLQQRQQQEDQRLIAIDGEVSLPDPLAQAKETASKPYEEKSQKKVALEQKLSEKLLKATSMNLSNPSNATKNGELIAEKKLDKIEMTFDEYLQSLSPYRTSVNEPLLDTFKPKTLKIGSARVRQDEHDDDVDNYQVFDFVERNWNYPDNPITSARSRVEKLVTTEAVPSTAVRIEEETNAGREFQENNIPLPTLPTPKISRPTPSKVIADEGIDPNHKDSISDEPTDMVVESHADRQPPVAQLQPSLFQSERPKFQVSDQIFRPLEIIPDFQPSIKPIYSDDDQGILLNYGGGSGSGFGGTRSEKKQRPKSAGAATTSERAKSRSGSFHLNIDEKHLPTFIERKEGGFDDFFSNLFLHSQSPVYVSAASNAINTNHPAYQFAQNFYYQRQEQSHQSRQRHLSQQQQQANVELYGQQYHYFPVNDHPSNATRPKSSSAHRSSKNKHQLKKKKSMTSQQQQKKANIISSYFG